MTSFPRSPIDELLPAITQALDETDESGAELNTRSGVLDALYGELVSRIELLLIHRRELLMSLLYRIDVKESLVVDVLGNAAPDEIAPRLAELIIERQVQKVRTRRTYPNNES